MLCQLSYFRVTFGCHEGTCPGFRPWHTENGSAARTGGVIIPNPLGPARRLVRTGDTSDGGLRSTCDFV